MIINETEIKLLESDPNTLIINYQTIIKIIVNKFISSGSINLTDKDEFIQIINERLLLSVEKIRNQYKGISLLRTYFSVIIKNICLEEIKKRNRNNFTEFESSSYINITESNIEEASYLNYEFDRLSKILNMYHSKAPKLIFCLKVIYRLKISISDFTKYCIKFSPKKINRLLEAVNQNKTLAESELFSILSPYINECDNQVNQPDALRRWLKRKIDEIILLMNGVPPRANYDKETLQILIEKFYMKKSDEIVQKELPN